MRIKQQPINLVFFFILATIPLLFGARHPLVQGAYTSLILFTFGIWLALNFEKVKPSLLIKANFPLYALLVFIFFTSIPLPFILIEWISPVRADSLISAIQIADLDKAVTSLSYYAPASRFYSVYLLGLLLYYLCAQNLLRRNIDSRAVMWIITIVGSFEALYGIMQSINPNLGVLWLPSHIAYEGYAKGTIIYRNQFAALMNMCWPMTVSFGILLYNPVMCRFTALKNRVDRVTLVDRLLLLFQKETLPFWAAAFMMLAVIFSGSRGGIIIMLILAMFFLVILPFTKKAKAIIFCCLGFFVALYGGMIGFENVSGRFFVISQGAEGRFLLWLDSLTMLKDHLITGIGMGTYQYLSPIYLTKVSEQLWFDFAHNEYLELAIELGIPAAATLFLWIFWQISRAGGRVIQAGRKIKEFTFYPENIIVAIGSFTAITGFLLHGFVDFVWRLPANAFYAVTLVAILNATFLSSDQKDGKQ